MRWEDLAIGQDEQATLPGYRDPASVRRFDAPEALDTRFYEIRARSVLNRVPEQSQMPFRWTVNPYRGCSHACLYCLAGDTQVLMADGRSRPIEQLRVGDRIVGTRAQGSRRVLVETDVRAKWSSIKPAWELRLQDGTRLVASGDHRLLAEDGWRHVADAARELPPRPHLEEGTALLGTGGFGGDRDRGARPERDRDYMKGYLTGIFRGEGPGMAGGTRGTAAARRAARRAGGAQQFRLALAESSALSRAELYLADLEASTQRLQLAAVGGTATGAVAATRTVDGERVRELLRWPLLPSSSWSRGFLAGVFDAEGTAGEEIRIASADPEILEWVALSLERLGFAHTLERGESGAGRAVRLCGGSAERMRFLQGTDPAVTGKREPAGCAVEADPGLRVASVRQLGTTMRMYDITTGTEDFIANGVVSHNCFARPTHTYLGFDAGRDFEREIVVKVNAPERLRAELGRRTWKGEHVALGTNTDPYQWVEGRYRLMEGIWEALRDAANPCSILTKSPLLLRDLKLMLEIREHAEFSACLSIPTLDEKAWRETEPRTPNPRARLEAVAELNRAGIPTGVLIAPLMPGINDAPEQVEPLLEAAAEAGATNVAGIALHLRGEVKDVFMGWMGEQRPELLPRYRKLYGKGAYAPREERERLATLTRRGGSPGAFWRNSRRADALRRKGPAGNGHGGEGEAIEMRGPPPRAVQQSLF